MTGRLVLPAMGVLNSNAKNIFGSQLKAWWQANSRDVASAAHTPIQDGDLVNSWLDIGGAGDSNRNIVQATANNQPSYTAIDPLLGNRPTVVASFTTHTKFLSNAAAWSASFAVPWAIFAAIYRDPIVTYSGNQYYWSAKVAGVRNDCFSNTLGSPAGTLSIIDVAELDSSVKPAGACVIGSLFNGASSKIYVNSKTALVTGNANSPALGAQALTFGAFRTTDASTGVLACHYGEIVAVTSPTAAQISELFDMWKVVYGCAVTP